MEAALSCDAIAPAGRTTSRLAQRGSRRSVKGVLARPVLWNDSNWDATRRNPGRLPWAWVKNRTIYERRKSALTPPFNERVPVATLSKLELRRQVRSQAGAWERARGRVQPGPEPAARAV